MTFFATIFGACIVIIATVIGVLTLFDGHFGWTIVFFGIALAHLGFVLYVRRTE